MNAAILEEATRIRDSFPEQSSALIPILHLWQEREGYISDEAIEQTAEFLSTTPAYVESVLTFYTLFRRTPGGKHRVQICRNVCCYLMGADNLIEHAKKSLGVDVGETTEDGLFSLETVECLAACGEGPTMQIDLDFCGKQTPESFDALMAKLREEAKTRA